MIITEKITIKVNSKDILHLNERGYRVKKNDIITIKVSDLSENSHRFIEASCDYCGESKFIKMQCYSNSLKKYGKYSCKICRYIKCKETMIERYGCEYPLQSEYISNKTEKSCLEKYGFKSAMQSEIIKDKVKITNLEKYGFKNVFQNENIKNKIKETNLEKYGFENAASSEIIKNKMKNTCNEKYGCDHFMKNSDEYEKYIKKSFKIKNYKNTELYYQGTYEFDFLEKYYDKVEIKNGIHVDYQFENSKCSYMPDFYLPKYNLMVEIKSNYTYKLHENKNVLKKEFSIKSGYNFLFIIDKDYTEFEKIINTHEKENV